MNLITKSYCLTLILLLFASVAMKAQVTIGMGAPPHKDALLDLKETALGESDKGLLLPRVSLKATDNLYPMTESDKSKLKGMTVYNLSTINTGNVSTSVTPGIYYHNGDEWVATKNSGVNWFYMPSANIPTNKGVNTFNLYQNYVNQFTGGFAPNIKIIGNPDAGTLPQIATYKETELNYYVTYYDPNLFDNISISDTGIMTYTIKEAPSEYSFINIVFTIK